MSLAVEPSIVLAAYAEPIASGRRVLFVGPAVSALPERLLERGARLVHVCDPDPVRLAEATARNRTASISFSALADGHFALRDGAFDVCIVEDAGIADTPTLVKRIRRALSPRGVALFASLNAEAGVPLLPHRPAGEAALDYYALYDAVSAEFEQVRMLGQAPFVGYVVADFAPDGTPEPSLDTAFVPSGAEEPELFIAVASQHTVSLDPFAVVQLPFRSVMAGSAADADAVRQARAAEQATREKLRELEAAREEDRSLGASQQERLRELTAEQARLSKLVAERDAKLREVETREARLREADTRDARLREAETKVFARDAELLALRQELENKNQQLRVQESSITDLTHKLSRGPSPEEATEAASELVALEKALQERGEAVRKLQRELREAERIGKELLRQLPEANPDSPAAKSVLKNAEAESLAQKLAKSQADLIATRWALEAAVRRGATAEPPEA